MFLTQAFSSFNSCVGFSCSARILIKKCNPTTLQTNLDVIIRIISALFYCYAQLHAYWLNITNTRNLNSAVHITISWGGGWCTVVNAHSSVQCKLQVWTPSPDPDQDHSMGKWVKSIFSPHQGPGSYPHYWQHITEKACTQEGKPCNKCPHILWLQ